MRGSAGRRPSRSRCGTLVRKEGRDVRCLQQMKKRPMRAMRRMTFARTSGRMAAEEMPEEGAKGSAGDPDGGGGLVVGAGDGGEDAVGMVTWVRDGMMVTERTDGVDCLEINIKSYHRVMTYDMNIDGTHTRGQRAGHRDEASSECGQNHNPPPTCVQTSVDRSAASTVTARERLARRILMVMVMEMLN
ncbi:hypothetical protein BCR44DRAFT_1435203 [Catenaria anguillulae PL171]|uniref:Uncharacterized protein n=1 Tax=Catenaria anguillulae PL171 TaxID=765915 RepID=A0A1Y2HKQ2_9FUNG|nr:hypothetical protein BCR44DRAFT_1435203 [Catenaria anguillulae PL171]